MDNHDYMIDECRAELAQAEATIKGISEILDVLISCPNPNVTFLKDGLDILRHEINKDQTKD